MFSLMDKERRVWNAHCYIRINLDFLEMLRKEQMSNSQNNKDIKLFFLLILSENVVSQQYMSDH